MQSSTETGERDAAPHLGAANATLRPATRDDVPMLTRVLARAFDRDPLANWIVLQDTRRVPRLERSFDLMLRHMSSNLNETYTTPDLAPGERRLLSTPRLRGRAGDRTYALAQAVADAATAPPFPPRWQLVVTSTEPVALTRRVDRLSAKPEARSEGTTHRPGPYQMRLPGDHALGVEKKPPAPFIANLRGAAWRPTFFSCRW